MRSKVAASRAALRAAAPANLSWRRPERRETALDAIASPRKLDSSQRRRAARSQRLNEILPLVERHARGVSRTRRPKIFDADGARDRNRVAAGSRFSGSDDRASLRADSRTVGSHSGQAPFRRSDHRRVRDDQGHAGRNGDRRRQDVDGNAGRGHGRAGRHPDPRRDGQRLPRPARRRADAAAIRRARSQRGSGDRRPERARSGAPPMRATSPTAPTRSWRSTICAIAWCLASPRAT